MFSCVTIDWYHAWPEEALVAVSKGTVIQRKIIQNTKNNAKLSFVGLMKDFEVDTTPEYKLGLYSFMGKAHDMVRIYAWLFIYLVIYIYYRLIYIFNHIT